MPLVPEERIRILTFKYIANSLTTAEDKELHDLMALYPEINELIRRMQDKQQVAKDLQLLHSMDAGKAYARAALPRIPQTPPVTETGWKRIAIAAAAIFLLLGIPAYLFLREGTGKPGKDTSPPSVADVNPGSDKATLTLINGSQIRLDSMPLGKVIDQTGSSLRMESSGCIAYTPSSAPIRENFSGLNEGQYDGTYYNTLTTPRAGQFAVYLPDGTKVWMNNASSLKYPTVFRGKNREVSFSGEGHFEVAKNTSQPFRVKVNDLSVDVLGTSFAIMAYQNEKEISATLLDGKVKLDNGVKTQIMSAGEKVIIAEGKPWKSQEHIDPDAAIAWQKGMFQFVNASLATVLEQLARWYDIDPEIHGEVPQHQYDVLISRKKKLSEILQALPHEDIQFRIEGRKLIVTKK